MKTTILLVFMTLAICNVSYSQINQAQTEQVERERNEPKVGDYVYFRLGGFICGGVIGEINPGKRPLYFVKFSIICSIGKYPCVPPYFNTIWLRRCDFVIARDWRF